MAVTAGFKGVIGQEFNTITGLDYAPPLGWTWEWNSPQPWVSDCETPHNARSGSLPIGDKVIGERAGACALRCLGGK